VIGLAVTLRNTSRSIWCRRRPRRICVRRLRMLDSTKARTIPAVAAHSYAAAPRAGQCSKFAQKVFSAARRVQGDETKDSG